MTVALHPLPVSQSPSLSPSSTLNLFSSPAHIPAAEHRAHCRRNLFLLRLKLAAPAGDVCLVRKLFGWVNLIEVQEQERVSGTLRRTRWKPVATPLPENALQQKERCEVV